MIKSGLEALTPSTTPRTHGMRTCTRQHRPTLVTFLVRERLSISSVDLIPKLRKWRIALEAPTTMSTVMASAKQPCGVSPDSDCSACLQSEFKGVAAETKSSAGAHGSFACTTPPAHRPGWPACKEQRSTQRLMIPGNSHQPSHILTNAFHLGWGQMVRPSRGGAPPGARMPKRTKSSSRLFYLFSHLRQKAKRWAENKATRVADTDPRTCKTGVDA